VQTGEVTCEGSIHILPSQVEISPFCTELTGITFDDLEYAETLQEALPALTANLLADQRVFASYGDFDRLQFERECEEKGIVYPFGRRHLNVKTLLAMKMGWSKELGMAEAMHKLGIEQLGRHHSAADDSFNIARLLKFALGRW
jgi:inhibitor of KinA sporulation pathway (predicted exonuclease)